MIPALKRGLDGVAGGLVAVGEDDDLGDVERRDRRGGHLDGGGEVGPLVVVDGQVEPRFVWIEPGSAAKSRKATRFGPASGQGLGEIVLGRLPRVVADAQAPVDREDDELVAGRPQQRQAGQGQDQQDHDQGPAGQDKTFCQGEVDQAPDEVVDEDGQDRQAEEPGGAGQLEGEPGGLGHLS